MRAPLDACMRIKGCLFVERKETKRRRSWHLVSPSVQRENHKCEARALRSRAIFEDINVDVQNTRSPSLLGGSGTFYVTDMTKSSGYRMNCEAIYAISRCCVEL